MYKIQTITAGSAVASLDFTVPSGYDDLYVVMSLRQTSNNGNPYTPITFAFNSSAANKSSRYLLGENTGVNSYSYSEFYIWTPSSLATSDTFGNAEMYISNYASSNAKSISLNTVSENNATANMNGIGALLWNSSATISTITLTPSAGNFATGSTATLFGIRKYNTTATPKATGGIITYANGYWVHTFTASGTFTPTQNLTCEYLVIAGGGGGGTLRGGGGGAGGYRSSVSGESSGGGASAESPLSLTAQAYTVTVGAGGAGSSNQSNTGTAGSNSVFSSITSTGGGGGASNSATTGGTGGSGGGAVSGGTAGSGTANQGYAGGAGAGASSNQAAGGGGGAGAVGVNATSGVAGAGGAGVSSSITGTAITRAGGGGGGAELTTAGAGGSGGGGAGTINSTTAGAGTSFTGSGGGGGGWTGSSAGIGGAGGSGVVIIRYAA